MVTTQSHPIILVDIIGTTTYKFATEDYKEITGTYLGLLLDFPNLTQELNDLWYGIESDSSVTLRFANVDNGIDETWLDIIAAQELRGLHVLIQRVDKVVGTTKTFQMRGKIVDWELSDEAMVINVEMRDDEVLETLLPLDVVTTDTFTDTAIDIGKPINICFGWCKDVPLRNIQNNTTSDQFDYLIGYGTLQEIWDDPANGRGVKRDGVLVNRNEYVFFDGSQVAPYPGCAFIRFTVEQRDFGMQFHSLTADVKGLEISGATAERNFANIIEALLQNTTWGLSENVDAASFNTAEAAYTAIGSLYCDGAISEQRKARDILNDLLFPFASIKRGADGEWEITVDTHSSSVLTVGDRDGLYNNCEVKQLRAVPATESMKNLTVHYDMRQYNDIEQNPYREMTTVVRSSFGVNRTYELPFISTSTSATYVMSRLKQRDLYGDWEVSMKMDWEGINLDPGDVITVHAPSMGLSSAHYKIVHFSKDNVSEYQAVARSYSSHYYDNLAITVPTAESPSSDYVNGPYADVAPWETVSTHFTAKANHRYLVSTTAMTSTGLQMTLPASSMFQANDVITWEDKAEYFGTNNFIIHRPTTSMKIEGYEQDMTCRYDKDNGFLKYTGSTYGWRLF